MFKSAQQDDAGTPRDPRVAVSLARLQALEFQARGFSFLPRQPVRSVLSGRHRSKLRGRGLNFEELRHYRPGDDIRTLDWKVTNRTGKPHVRVYGEESERSVLLLVDQRVSMFFGSRNAMKSVVAAEVAALAAWRVIASGDRIGGVIFDDDQCHAFAERRNRGHVLAMLGQLAKSNAALRPGRKSNAGQLNIALDALLRRLSHDALVIYIGDGHGFDDATQKLIKRIALHNDFLAVSVVDPAERELPDLEHLVVSDGDLQISVSARGSAARNRYRELFAQDMGLMGAALSRYGVPVITMNTVDPPLQQVIRALGGLVK